MKLDKDLQAISPDYVRTAPEGSKKFYEEMSVKGALTFLQRELDNPDSTELSAQTWLEIAQDARARAKQFKETFA